MSFWPRPAWQTICRSKTHGGPGITGVEHQHQQLALHMIYIRRMLNNRITSFLTDQLQQFILSVHWTLIHIANHNVSGKI
jgi:hypothetical protein